jgi:hypothetical protein
MFTTLLECMCPIVGRSRGDLCLHLLAPILEIFPELVLRERERLCHFTPDIFRNHSKRGPLNSQSFIIYFYKLRIRHCL